VNKFDSIRPYLDEEVHEVLLGLSNNRRFLKMLFATGEFKSIRYLPFSRKILSHLLKNKIKNVHDVSTYQDLFEGIVSNVVKTTVNNFSVSGINKLDPKKGYLFISNHRDITLDSALLNLSLHQNNFKTTYSAVGNNLLNEKWASDLMRLNKSFIIDRSDKSKKDIYKSLTLASDFIFDKIRIQNESIWIAQKQGRSKDGNDYTDPSVIKMIHLNSRKKVPVDQYLNSLSVVPVSISYEKDPNDLLKARELYLTDLNQTYIKEPKEDLQSISDGIRGTKGDVFLNIGDEINFNTDAYEACSDKITKEIKDLYKPHATNYAAAIIQGKKTNENIYSADDIDGAIEYLKNRMKTIPEDMHPYLLNQYANPVL